MLNQHSIIISHKRTLTGNVIATPYNTIFSAIGSLNIPSRTAVNIFLEKLWKVGEMLSGLVDNGGCSVEITTSHAVIYHWPRRQTINRPVLIAMTTLTLPLLRHHSQR